MKNKQIGLIQTANDDNLYIVDSLVNRIEPKLGMVLKPSQVRELMSLRDTKVTIKRARGS